MSLAVFSAESLRSGEFLFELFGPTPYLSPVNKVNCSRSRAKSSTTSSAYGIPIRCQVISQHFSAQVVITV